MEEKNTHIFILADYIDLHLMPWLKIKLIEMEILADFDIVCVCARACLFVYVNTVIKDLTQAHFDSRTRYKKITIGFNMLHSRYFCVSHINERRVFFTTVISINFSRFSKWFLLVNKNKNNKTKYRNQKWSKTKYTHTPKWVEKVQRDREIVVMCIWYNFEYFNG